MSKVITIFIDLVCRLVQRLTGKVNTMLNQWRAMGYLLRKGASVSCDAKWLGGGEVTHISSSRSTDWKGFYL